MPPTLSSRRYLACGAAAAALVAVLPDGATRLALYALVGISAVAVTVVGQRRHRPARPVAWLLVALAATCFVVGDVVAMALTSRGPAGDSSGGVSDLLFVLAYVAMAAGLVVLVGSRGLRHRWTARLDGLLVTVNVALLSWVLLVEPTWHALADAPPVARLLLAAYPVADVVLLGGALRVAATAGARNPAGRLLVAALGCTLLADSVAQAARLLPELEPYVRLSQSIWLLGYVLLGATALHPSVRGLAFDTEDGAESLHPGRLVLLAAWMLTGPALAAGQVLAGARVAVWPILLMTPVVVSIVLVRMMVMLRSLSEQADRLSALADTDYVTGLPNRRRFADDLTAFLARGTSGRGTVLLVGLDRFTEVSDSLGRAAGDEILEATARRLRHVLGRSAVIARTANDSYGVLDRTTTTTAAAESVASAVRAALEAPHQLPDLTVSLDVHVGVVVVPQDAGDAAGALRRAELALAAAGDRPGRVARYVAELGEGSQATSALLKEVSAALDAGQIVLHYQPQVCLLTGRVLGVEALARWEHPERGLLGPASFITAVEQSGLIGPFTEHVLDTALAQCAQWHAEGRELTMAVNLSVRNLLDPALVEKVQTALLRHRVQANLLELEITEGSAMVDRRRSAEVIGALAALGIMLSIDDYGTGYCSLAYLQRLPVGRLKIDRSFVDAVLRDTGSAAIVRSTVELARSLGLTVVAEGVEDDETLLAIRGMRCEAAQGFGLGRPVPAAQVLALLATIEARLPELLGAEGRAVPNPRLPVA